MQKHKQMEELPTSSTTVTTVEADSATNVGVNSHQRKHKVKRENISSGGVGDTTTSIAIGRTTNGTAMTTTGSPGINQISNNNNHNQNRCCK